MKRDLALISTLLAVLLLTTACFGGGENEAPTSQATTPPTIAPTSAPTQASEPTVAPTATEVVITPEATVTTTAPAAGESASTVLTVEEAPAILSYRSHITVASDGPRGGDSVRIEGAYTKNPPAEQLVVDTLQGGQSQHMETLLVDGTRYIHTADSWMQAPGSNLNVGELTLLAPKDVTGIVGQMQNLGTESVNGLSAAHYQGGKEVIPVAGTEGDTLDVSQVDSAQLDLWVDDTYNAIVRLMLQASQVEPAMAFTLTYDYTDFNTDIQIVAPQIAAATPVSGTQPEGDSASTNALTAMLGFNLIFPTGSTVEVANGTQLFIIVAPFTLEQATVFLEQAMQSNGYLSPTKAEVPGGGPIYVYIKDGRTLTINLADAGGGQTRFQFVGQ